MKWDQSNPGHPNVKIGPYSESEFCPSTPECPNPEYWTTMDAQSTENEVIDLVYGLIRGLQPEWVLETGTSRGFMARSIMDALAKNGHGHLVTYEPDEPTYQEAMANMVGGGMEWATPKMQPSMQPWEWGPIDFAWFDSAIDLRYSEFAYYYEHASPRCIVGFHDTSPRFGEWADIIYRDPRIYPMSLPTPRGCILGRIDKS